MLALTLAVGLTRPAAAITDEEVSEAIERMQDWLYDQQDPQTGGWPTERADHAHHAYGESALVVLALLLSGESVQERLVFDDEDTERPWDQLSRPERLARGLRFLREIGFDQGFNGTYSVGIRSHVWAQLPDQYLNVFERDAQWLLQAHNGSIFDYGPSRGGRVDHSTTQYGILGLWEFSKRGGGTPRQFWEDAASHFVNVQNADGGWAYGLNENSRGSMTAAGLTVLYITLQELYRGDDRPPSEIANAIDAGLAWLDQRFNGLSNPNGGHPYYYIYSIERVALASGVKFLNGRDWFESGATALIGRMDNNGSISNNLVSTAFALGFLARGRVPVWVNKLQVPEHNWNNRPNDIYFLTRHLSELYQRELNWQFVDVGSDPDDWLNAPVAYLASDDAVTFTDEQKANLKHYLDLGGTLIASPDGNNRQFVDSIRTLAGELYPDYQPQQLEPDHPIASMIYDVPRNALNQVWTVNNGARDLIVLANRDWGRTFQSDTPSDRDATWQMITNTYAMVTGRGNIPNRLVSPFVERDGARQPSGEVKVVRAEYDGNWRPEPAAWEPLRNPLYNQTGVELAVDTLPLADLADAEADLVHLAGVEAAELSDEQKQAIKAYVDAGGTVLIETVGGEGDFSIQAERQLRDTFRTAAVQLPSYSPILTGRGLERGHNNRRVVYRPYAVLNFTTGTSPRLAAFMVDDRPAIVFSHEDLSLGILGSRHWNVNGYETDSARKIMTNLLLTAQQDKP
ncbi:MAG: DUF4159 domain-containing protein [Phycisphaeraceae bacterium]